LRLQSPSWLSFTGGSSVVAFAGTLASILIASVLATPLQPVLRGTAGNAVGFQIFRQRTEQPLESNAQTDDSSWIALGPDSTSLKQTGSKFDRSGRVTAALSAKIAETLYPREISVEGGEVSGR